MKFNLSRFIFAITVTLTAFSFASQDAAAQSEIGQSWFDGGSYNSQSEVDAMYHSNAQLPLGGLFAPSFTRTLTILGGANFLSDGPVDSLARSQELALRPLVFPSVLPPREVDNNGYAISFAFGRRHNHRLRSEIEVAFRSNEINQREGFQAPVTSFEGNPISPGSPGTLVKDGNITATSLMKNFIIDFTNDSRFTPYVGAGIGLSYIDIRTGEASSVDGETTRGDDETLFSYQAIGGVATQLNSVADFIVEYRFLGTSEGEFDIDGLSQNLTYNTSSLFLGVKFEY